MTTAPTPKQLMAGFKDNFGEIIDLITEASDKTGPWVTDRIKKMPKKTQDEIYGRFNEACNGGLKNAAAGREFYESSLDFPALAQKTTQVADDIELADQINKLFLRNAPVLEHYKKLSESARKEIEKHLKTTADKAKPEELQNALITVFNGMGRLESEAAKKQERTGSEKKLLYLAYTFRHDYEILKGAKGYLEIRGGEWNYEDRQNIEDNLFNRLSPYAQLLIEQRLRAHCPGDFSASSPARDAFINQSIPYHIGCHKSADYVKSTMLSLLKSFEANENSKSILKNVDTNRLGKMEKLLLDEYLGYPRLIAHGHLGSKFEPATHDFEDFVLNDHRKRTEKHLPPEHEVFANQEFELGELQSQFNKDRDIQILGQLPGYVTSPKNDKQGFIAKYADMSNANQEDFALYLKDTYEATLNSASPNQLWLCCKEYGPEIIKKLYLTKNLFTKYDFLSSVMFPPPPSRTPSSSSSISSTSSSAKSAPKAEPVKVEPIELTDEVVNRIVELAVAYKIDLAVLKQAKHTNADFKTVFEKLSPYAQLLIELRTPQYSGLTAFDGVVSKCTNDPHTTKTVFLDLLQLFELNEEEQYIYTTQAIKLRSTELNLLFQYLRYPRYLANNSFRKTPNCTFEDFREEISSKAREITPASSDIASDFRNLDRLVVEAITQADKDMSASEDFQTYDKPELKKNWLLCNRKPSEPRTPLFGNAKFLDGVYATLPFPKAEPQTASATSVKVEPTKPVERTARTKTEDRFIAYAQAFKQDYSLLEQHRTYFKDSNPDKEELLKIYKGLSPYGQLLIMQRLIWNDPGPYNNLGDAEKGKMDAIVEQYVAYDLRNALLLFLVSQDSKMNIQEFVDFPSELSKLGSMEKTLLRAYLDYPRELTLEYLKSGSKENFEEVLLLKFRENKHVSFDEFEATFASQLSENDRHFTNHKDYQLYQGLLTYLNQQDSPVHKEGFLNTYYNLSYRTRAAHDDILKREFNQTIGNDNSGATVEQLRVSFKLLELEIRKQVFPEYFIGNYRLFSRIDFLDRVIHALFPAN